MTRSHPARLRHLLLREDGRVRIAWDGLQVVSGIITGLLLPYWIVSPNENAILTPLWFILACLGVVDIWINTRTSFEFRGRIHTKPKEIMQRYARGWLTADILANVPALFMHSISGLSLLQLFRCNRIFRSINRWERLHLINPLILRICRYLICLALLVNWIGAAWLWTGLHNHAGDSWLSRHDLATSSFNHQYLISIYWTITTLASVGYGDITPKTIPEVLVAMTAMCAGVLIIAFAIGNVVTILNQLDGGKAEYQMRQASIRRYLLYNGVKPETFSRLRQFNSYLWDHFHGERPEAILADLPSSIRGEITLEMLQETIKDIPLFQQSPPHLRNKLLMLLKPEVYAPGSLILDEDEEGDDIVFVVYGNAEVIPDEDIHSEERIIYGAGDYFGDLSFFLKERRNCQVIARDYVEAFVLNRVAFDALNKKDSHLKTVLQSIAAGQSARNRELLIAGLVV